MYETVSTGKLLHYIATLLDLYSLVDDISIAGDHRAILHRRNYVEGLRQ